MGRIDVSAAREGDQLVLVVQDNGPGIGDRSQDAGMGIGVANTRARLEQLYGAMQSLELENAPEGGARVRVQLPLRAGAATDAEANVMRDARSA
jgi:sensor histidine kinase YesM